MTEVGSIADQHVPEVDAGRRKFLTAATAAVAGVGAVVTVVPFVESWQPSERARALGAPVEVDLTKLSVGQMVTPIWRRQPIYVVRRDPKMVDALSKNDSNLKDPKSDHSIQPKYAQNEMRSVRADVLVLIGICTHLGCLPKQFFDAGDAALGPTWPGGFRCPCHGSRFDMAGRVMDGSPAPTNLSIPPYTFKGDNTLVVGVDPTNKSKSDEGAA
ncbi:MAG TPA: ubiquinol-cytochrome c reductase iron-sulfur subunit [Steroidobacteraceae bacterium]|jgi:ubiquinol-cytochrome c reductase iron-sulfur subunit|nr:ubiquinol-cytochrome c reductase iron-sulfur subunit [Steroidobacteraceae bacterium]